MADKWTPKVVYGTEDPITFLFTHPSGPWDYENHGIGGADHVGGGGEALLIRRERIIKTKVRFTETQLPNVELWFEYMQDGYRWCEFWFDQDDEDTAFVVYLHSPILGEGDFSPARNTFSGMYELLVELRRVDGSKFTGLNWSGYDS